MEESEVNALRAAIVATHKLCNTRGIPAARTQLARFNATRISEIDPTDLAQYTEECEQLVLGKSICLKLLRRKPHKSDTQKSELVRTIAGKLVQDQ